MTQVGKETIKGKEYSHILPAPREKGKIYLCKSGEKFGGKGGCAFHASETGACVWGKRCEDQVEAIGFYLRDGPYGFLSNFHRCTLISGGKEYPTLEHLYHSQKAIGSEFQEWIRLAPNPYLAMKAGGSLRAGKLGELREDWEDLKLSYMLVDLRLKFQDPELKEKLITTGDAYLYEDSPNDVFWGLVDGKGENHLGKLLMKVREEVR